MPGRLRSPWVCHLFEWEMSQGDCWGAWAFGDVGVAGNSPSCVAEHETLPWLGGPRQSLMWVLLFDGRVSRVFRNPVHYTRSWVSLSVVCYRQRICLRSAVLFKAADERVPGPTFVDMAGAEEGSRRPWWARDFLYWLLRWLKALGFLTWVKCFQTAALRYDALEAKGRSR